MTDVHVQTTLLTGATGFLGHYLLRDLLAAGRRVVILLRPPLEASVDRLRALMHGLGVELDGQVELGRALPVAGDLPGAIPDPEWGRTDEVVHCAASLQLFVNGNQDPFRTNVEGARALLAWAERHGVRTLHVVSTAYVCGMNRGCIAEVIHAPRPTFQTDYEHSKWQAERLLWDWGARPGRSLTLYRPSFVVGDSGSGYTTQFRGFYQLARLVSMLKRHENGSPTYVPLRIPLHPEGRHNVVPVDFAARLIVAGVLDPRWHGRIYHLTDPDPPDNGFWKGCFEEFFHLHGGYFVDPREIDGARSPEEAMLWEQIDVLVPRLNHTPQFSQDNTLEVLRSRGWEFPALDRARVLRLLDYAVASAWGRRGNGRLAPVG